MTDDDVRGALDLLARRADAHLVPDRVPAVRRRARRAAQVRTAALAAAAVVVVGAAATLLPGGGLLRGSGPAVTRSVVTPHLDVEVAPETDRTVLQAAATGPDGSNGFPLVLIVVHIRGTVPAARDGSAPYGVSTDDGAGSSGGSTALDCPPGAPLVALDTTEIVTLPYPAEMAHTSAPVVLTVSACAPVEQVVRRFTVRVPESGTAASDFTASG